MPIQAGADNPKAAVWCIQHGSSWRVYLMARTASRWFWQERKGWYVNKDGQRHFLGEHPDGASPPRKHKGKWNTPQPIMLKFHELMAAPPEQPAPKLPPSSGPTVPEILDKYLDWCQKHRAGRTYEDAARASSIWPAQPWRLSDGSWRTPATASCSVTRTACLGRSRPSPSGSSGSSWPTASRS